MARNPFATKHAVLGHSLGDWNSAVNSVRAHLQANDHLQEIPDAVLQALDPLLADARTWNAVREELGLDQP